MQKIKKLSLAAIAFSILCLCCSFALRTQESHAHDEKNVIVTLQKLPAFMDVPVQVTGMIVKGKRYDLDTSFKAKDDWLKDFSVIVKNVSNRPIIGVSFNLEWVARDPADGLHYIPMTPLFAGRQVVEGADAPAKGFPLQPGESAEVYVEWQWYESHIKHKAGKAHAQHKQIPEDVGRRAHLYFNNVGFDEDHIWHRGNYARRDPADPQRFVADEEQKKKISQYLRSQPTTQRVSYTPGKSSPGCSRWDDLKVVACTLINCPEQPAGACTVTRDVVHEEASGFKQLVQSEECRKVQGGKLVACGCCQNTMHLCYEPQCILVCS